MSEGRQWFRNFEDAIWQANFWAAITRLRYRVHYDPRNRWWNITETTIRIAS